MRSRNQRRFVLAGAQSSRPLIGLTLVGVLADPLPLFAREAKRRHNLTLDPELDERAINRRLVEHTGEPSLHSWTSRLLADPEFVGQLAPLDEAADFVRTLTAAGIELRVIYDRAPNEGVLLMAERLLARISISRPPDLTRDKPGWTRQTRARWFVERDPSDALTLAETGCRVLVPAHPSNAYLEGEVGITRVSALLDIAKIACQDL